MDLLIVAQVVYKERAGKSTSSVRLFIKDGKTAMIESTLCAAAAAAAGQIEFYLFFDTRHGQTLDMYIEDISSLYSLTTLFLYTQLYYRELGSS